ncbi:hypothetical protein Trydic_g4733 [Trypoxylus dichotomus]
MNCNEFARLNYRGRNRNFRGRGARAVNVQRPLVGQFRKTSTRKTTSTNFGSSTSSIKWKNHSSTSNNLTVTVTKSTSSKTNTTFDADSSKIVIAISAGRGEASCEVGIAALDVCKPTLVLCQISDTPSYINTLTKINILNPDEILIPMTFVQTSSSNRLVNKIKQHFKNITITAVPRATYNKLYGIQFIKELCAPQWDSIFLVLQHKYYCLTAASALLTYIESALFVIYNKQSLKVEYQESEGYCIIDVSTADKLELVACNTVTTNEKYSSLYGILNYCLTKIGARTLRATILQPPCSIPDIEARLECVTELKKNSDMLMSVQTILPKISNIDQLLSLATLPSDQGDNFTERHLMYVLTLSALLDLLEPLKETFENSQQHFFKEFRATLNDDAFKEISHLMKSLIQPDAHPAKGQQGIIEKCFLIKPGVNGLLDVLRKTYSERVEDLREYVRQLRDKYNLPLTLSNNYKKGYHIILQLNAQTKKTFKKSELPQEFVQVERLYSSVTMKTTEMMNLAARIDDILLEILKMSSVMVYQILIEVRNHIGLFYKLCEYVAKLDMVQSLAQASSGIGYTRPEFGDYLDIMNSKHPLLDFLCSMEPTSNSIFATPEHNVHIITGPNGSGKSIFIRQVLLLQVMAQVGCFIPAETATLRVCDRILARVYFDDNMDCGASSFVVEIKEIQYFHTVMTSNTLIIIDELCRSTAVDEGTVLAMAMIESLAKSKAFIFLATHYTFITKLEELYPNLTKYSTALCKSFPFIYLGGYFSWQMETTEEKKQRTALHFTYSLVPGITTFKKYGLSAAVASWSKDILEEAEELYNQIEPCKQGTGIKGMHVLNRLKYNFEAQLKMLKAKKQLTSSVFQEKCYTYLENLKNAGLELSEYLLEDPTFQGVEAKEVEDDIILPQAVYSPSESFIEDNNVIENYDQFFQGIQSLNQEIPRYEENKDPRAENETNISLMISQQFNRRIEEGHQMENNSFSEGGDGSQVFDNVLSNLDQNQSDFASIPWKSNSISEVYTVTPTQEYKQALDKVVLGKSLRSSNQIDDADVSAAIEELNECSTYFTQEWDELDSDDGQNNEVEPKSFDRTLFVARSLENDVLAKPNVIIHSVHIVNKNDKIEAVQKFDHAQGKLVEVVKQNLSPITSETSFKHMQDVESNRRQCITSFSGEHSGSNLDNNSFVNGVGNVEVNGRSFGLNYTPQRKTQEISLANDFFKCKLQENFSKISNEKSTWKPPENTPTGKSQYHDVTYMQNASNSARIPNENVFNLSLEPRNDTQIFNIGSQPDFTLNDTINQTPKSLQKMDNSISAKSSWFSAVGSQEFKGTLLKKDQKVKTGRKNSFADAFFEMQAKKDVLRILQRSSEDPFSVNTPLNNSNQNPELIQEVDVVQVQNDQKNLDQNPKGMFDFEREDCNGVFLNEESRVSNQSYESRSKLQNSAVKLYSSKRNVSLNSIDNKKRYNESIIDTTFPEEHANKISIGSTNIVNDFRKNKVETPPKDSKDDFVQFEDIASNAFPSTEERTGRKINKIHNPNDTINTNATTFILSDNGLNPSKMSSKRIFAKIPKINKIQNPNDTINSNASTFVLSNNSLNPSKMFKETTAIFGNVPKISNTQNPNDTIDSNATAVVLSNNNLNPPKISTAKFEKVGKISNEREDKISTHQNEIKDSLKMKEEIPKSLKTYFQANRENLSKTPTYKVEDGNGDRPLTQENLDSSILKCKNVPYKSQKRSIFETSNASESLFSSPETFYSAVETIPQPKKQLTPMKRKQKVKFVPPLKNVKTSVLSKKEILEDFEKQRRRLLENQDDPDHIEKYLKFITNRPKVEQIQGQRCIAKITKTSEGVVVIPASNPIVKRRKVVPLKRTVSSEYDKTMFSDRNENKLKCLLENEQKNIFNFNESNWCQDAKEKASGKQEDTQIPMFSGLGFSQSNPSNMFNFDDKDIGDIIAKYLRD